ncbi:Na+/H+ antiporter [Actinacidiphila acidipaludis]|uniref:Na+/H+ antiporter n=1 Tax=Actinacidiphila acidipaludis TaxID=2873382 RepID=A0ABS7QB53_9ACTN|nr:Na+/H+ antiporter [Streptomyces acidipaludis]MBY8879675.1 Na+/H+ antiporter [Streptomyces acidipaludis]
MTSLEVISLLLAAVLFLTWLARAVKVTEPVVLLLGGVLLGLIPQLRGIHLPATVVLLIFLPPLLYVESLSISLRQMVANLRVIVIMSVGLVLLTAVTVASVTHSFGTAWPIAFVLGAVVAPTDATAVTTVARGLPRRTLTTLKAESLVNDGTALVIFALAVDVATSAQHFTWGHAVWRFVVSYAGGIAIGAVVGWVVMFLRRHVRDTQIESGLSVFTPFAAYLPAEKAGVSGVLAVVVAGLTVSWASPLMIPAGSRVPTMAFWRVTTFLLNGALFVLVGLQLPNAVSTLTSLRIDRAVALTLAVSATVILTRLAYVITVPYAVRALDRRPRQRLRRRTLRERIPAAWGGVRGAISLAAALAVPVTTEQGAALTDRDVIVFVTAGVITITLVLQGETMPWVIRRMHFPVETNAGAEEVLARRRVDQKALAELPGEAEKLGSSRELTRRVERELTENVRNLRRGGFFATYRAEYSLRRALLDVKRVALVELRDTRVIDDTVLRRVQESLDVEETRLELAKRAAHTSDDACRRAVAAGGREPSDESS